MKWIVALVACSFCLYLHAEEVDDFTYSKTLAPDASAYINESFRDRLRKFAMRYNQLNHGCERKVLLRHLYAEFNSLFTNMGTYLYSKHTNYVEAKAVALFEWHPVDKALDKVAIMSPVSRADGIYGGSTMRTPIVDAVNIDGIPIGIDKIDHFFGNGGMLFQEYDQMVDSGTKDIAIGQIIQKNAETEQGKYGLYFTGVKSYGDLAANWAGFKFWTSFIDGKNPMLKCEDGKLRVLRNDFDIKQHVNWAWNESVNCSSFSDPAVARKVKMNLMRIGKNCPADPDKCLALGQAYPDARLAETLISPVCREQKAFPVIETAIDNVDDWGLKTRMFLGGQVYFRGRAAAIRVVDNIDEVLNMLSPNRKTDSAGKGKK